MPLGKEVGLGPGHIVLDGGPSGDPAPTAASPHFRPMPIVTKRSPISATAELLFHLTDGRKTPFVFRMTSSKASDFSNFGRQRLEKIYTALNVNRGHFVIISKL